MFHWIKLEEVCNVPVERDCLRVHVPVFLTMPTVFTKLLNIPISLLRKINISVIIYLGGMLILSQTIQEAYMNWDTFTYLLQNLGFIINIRKSIWQPFQKIEFPGMKINSVKMTNLQRFFNSNKLCLRGNKISVSGNIKHQVKKQINLMARELEVLQWPNVFAIDPTNDVSNRCFPDRARSSLQREMVIGGENLAHKSDGTASDKIGSISL